LHGFNGDESDELPLAATYVIDQNGGIVYTFLDAEYTNRAEAKDILAALDSIKNKLERLFFNTAKQFFWVFLSSVILLFS
jgi:hypothetical protein